MRALAAAVSILAVVAFHRLQVLDVRTEAGGRPALLLIIDTATEHGRCIEPHGGRTFGMVKMAANIECPTLPENLYRYRSLGVHDNSCCKNDNIVREIETIKDRYIWSSSYKDMNDPMEGFYRKIRDIPKSIIRDIRYNKSKIGITCFSNTNDNELMWAHYAGNYSGMCVSYRTNDLIDGLSETVSLVKLSYNDKSPRMARDNLSITVKKILSQKKSIWAYEQEWRIMSSQPGRRLCFNRDCIDHIYLGLRIAPENKKAIKEALRGTGVPISCMSVHGYAHSWTLMTRSRST